jgi:hypothetical protein
MGKTVPSYRMALEFEINRWKSSRKALLDDEDRGARAVLRSGCFFGWLFFLSLFLSGIPLGL